MSGRNRVIWSEGMFMLPQHFQQSDRYFESLIDNRTKYLRTFPWGISSLTIDQAALAIGQFAVTNAVGVLEDGTPFIIPDDAMPPSLPLGQNVRDCIVYLTLPRTIVGTAEFILDDNAQSHARYRAAETEVLDCTSESDETAAVLTGKPQLRFVLETEPRADLVCVGVARIAEVRADRLVVLDTRYIPPCLSVGASPALGGFLVELQGLLHQRADALAGRLSEVGGNAAPQTSDFLLLLAVNRWAPAVTHLARLKKIHPEDFYTLCLGLAGELAAFTKKSRRPIEFPEYRHDDLRATFAPVIEELRIALTMMIDSAVERLPLQFMSDFGVWYSPIKDKSLLSNANLILAVRADVKGETLRSVFPGQSKIGPAEKIRELIHAASRGIQLTPLPTAPRQLPYHAGTVYLELERRGPFWEALKSSAGLAFHISGDFPQLDMELWAIREVAS